MRHLILTIALFCASGGIARSEDEMTVVFQHMSDWEVNCLTYKQSQYYDKNICIAFRNGVKSASSQVLSTISGRFILSASPQQSLKSSPGQTLPPANTLMIPHDSGHMAQ